MSTLKDFGKVMFRLAESGAVRFTAKESVVIDDRCASVRLATVRMSSDVSMILSEATMTGPRERRGGSAVRSVCSYDDWYTVVAFMCAFAPDLSRWSVVAECGDVMSVMEAIDRLANTTYLKRNENAR